MNSKYLQIVGTGVLLASIGIGLYNTKSGTTQKLDSLTSVVSDASKAVTINGESITLPLQIICSDEKLKLDKDPYIREIASFIDKKGAPIFNCEDAYLLQMQGVEADYIRDLVSLRDHEKNPLFTAKDIINFRDAEGTVEYAQQFANSSFSGKQLSQLYCLGLDLEDLVTFHDTAKPNALLVYPTEDQATTFRTDDSVELFELIGEAYDIKVKVASTEDEVYDALDRSQGFKLAVFSGHGTETTLALGKNLGGNSLEQNDESYFIDISDSESAEHLKYLHPKAIIFLNSCSTAKEMRNGNNLAEKVAGWSRGRTVIAASEDSYVSKITVNSLYPFDVTLKDFSEKKDITVKINFE